MMAAGFRTRTPSIRVDSGPNFPANRADTANALFQMATHAPTAGSPS